MLLDLGAVQNADHWQRIIPDIRLRVFDGIHIMFSGVIPLTTDPETTEIWRMAHMFGAQCYTELNRSVTHVVATKVRYILARTRLRIYHDCVGRDKEG